MKKNKIKLLNDSNQNIRVDNYLSLRIEDMSRTKLKKIIHIRTRIEMILPSTDTGKQVQ